MTPTTTPGAGGFLPRDDTIVRTGEEDRSFFFDKAELNASGWWVPRLLYDHMPKADGTFLSDILRKGAEKKHFVLRREFDSLTDSDRLNTFTVGSVRNPCDYYVSLWSYGVEQGGSLFAKVPPEQRWVYSTKAEMKNSQADIFAFRKWVQYMNRPGFPGIMSVRFAKSYVKGVDVDAKWPPASLNDTVLREVNQKLAAFDKQDIKCWVHHETLVQDADSCLLKWSFHSHTRPQWGDYNEAKKASFKKASTHAPCTAYFDAATAEMVKDAEQHIFRLFDYPTCCAPQPTPA